MWVLLCSQFYVLTIDRTVTLKSEYLLFLIMVYCSTIGQFIILVDQISVLGCFNETEPWLLKLYVFKYLLLRILTMLLVVYEY